jgi:hypothetical protein
MAKDVTFLYWDGKIFLLLNLITNLVLEGIDNEKNDKERNVFLFFLLLNLNINLAFKSTCFSNVYDNGRYCESFFCSPSIDSQLADAWLTDLQ